MGARLTMLLTAAVVIAALGAGCGDDAASDEQAGGGTVTTSSLSKPQFIKQASAACIREGKELSEEVNAYAKKHASQKQPESVFLANLIKAIVLPSIEAQSAAMQELGAPAGDEEDIEAIFAAQQEGIDQTKELTRLKSTEIIENYFADFNKQLEAYGFTACVYG